MIVRRSTSVAPFVSRGDVGIRRRCRLNDRNLRLACDRNQTNHTAIEQSASSDILTAVAADLRATPKTSPPGRRYPFATGPRSTYRRILPLPRLVQRFISLTKANAHLPLLVSHRATLLRRLLRQSNNPHRLGITFLPNGPGTRTATFVDLRTTWPAATADPTKASAAETFLALDRN